MTRINTVPVHVLADEHLMAEYRELPMIHGSLKRSLARFGDRKVTMTDLNIPRKYCLGAGHVKHFYNKREYLLVRWRRLISELYRRGYQLKPSDRSVDWSVFNQVYQNYEWTPTYEDMMVNARRIEERLIAKPHLYHIYRQTANVPALVDEMYAQINEMRYT